MKREISVFDRMASELKVELTDSGEDLSTIDLVDRVG